MLCIFMLVVLVKKDYKYVLYNNEIGNVGVLFVNFRNFIKIIYIIVNNINGLRMDYVIFRIDLW